MSNAFIVGAGFSKTIGSSMPLMSELSVLLNDDLPNFRAWTTATFLATTNLELQLSSLAVNQPFLDEATNYRNRALYLEIAEWLAHRVYVAQAHVLGSPLPPWLEALVQYWNRTRATVITLNYDTLVESAITSINLRDQDNHHVNFQDTYAMRLQFAEDRWNERKYSRYGQVKTFRLCKLHGSLSWFRNQSSRDSPMDVETGKDSFNQSDRHSWAQILDRGVGLDGPLLIPPTLVKSDQYENALVRANWRQAYAGLDKASAVYVLGYSFPTGDSQMAALLGTTCREKQIVIVDLDPSVKDRVSEACRGGRFNSIGMFTNEGAAPIADFATGLRGT